MWVEDSQAAACQNCQAEFSVAKRRVSSSLCLLYKIHTAVCMYVYVCVHYTVKLLLLACLLLQLSTYWLKAIKNPGVVYGYLLQGCAWLVYNIILSVYTRKFSRHVIFTVFADDQLTAKFSP